MEDGGWNSEKLKLIKQVLVSKVLLKLKKMQPTWECFSSMVCQWCVASNNRIIVDCLEQNPHWFSDRMLFVMRWSGRNWCKFFSRILLIIGRRDMGWKDCTSCGVESLGIGTILEDFHSAGSWPVLIERLKREVRKGAISTANVFSIQEEMPSGPEAECSLVLRSMF